MYRWTTVEVYRWRLSATGELAEKRRCQALAWMWSRIEDGLKERLYGNPQVGARLRDIEAAVQRGELSPTIGAEFLLFLLDNDR